MIYGVTADSLERVLGVHDSVSNICRHKSPTPDRRGLTRNITTPTTRIPCPREGFGLRPDWPKECLTQGYARVDDLLVLTVVVAVWRLHDMVYSSLAWVNKEKDRWTLTPKVVLQLAWFGSISSEE